MPALHKFTFFYPKSLSVPRIIKENIVPCYTHNNCIMPIVGRRFRKIDDYRKLCLYHPFDFLNARVLVGVARVAEHSCSPQQIAGHSSFSCGFHDAGKPFLCKLVTVIAQNHLKGRWAAGIHGPLAGVRDRNLLGSHAAWYITSLFMLSDYRFITILK